MVDFAFVATERSSENLTVLAEKLTSEDPLVRYWAAQGCLILGEEARPAAEGLRQLLNDKYSAVRATAAQTLIGLGEPEKAYEILFNDLRESENHYVQLNLLNIYSQLNALERIPDEWIKKLRARAGGRYVERMLDEIAESRGI